MGHNAEEKRNSNVRFSRVFAVELLPEYMVPTGRRPSAQGIKCPTVHSRHFPETSHRVWWLRRLASTFTCPEPIKQRVYATSPPTLQEPRNRIADACATVSHAMLYNVQWEVQSRVQMCIVAFGQDR
ncbi:hypothetical protein AVEN_215563-1 [Araneus ventricosus]|uniref:Uncharacterized protein n=1 Tax=Araneus ventricosus TaxID=182803 RepID=A0A4Y2BFT6_ARAVE|nr:hypothetical protein AVEN_215563-1 [Araneus ventricosus]